MGVTRPTFIKEASLGVFALNLLAQGKALAAICSHSGSCVRRQRGISCRPDKVREIEDAVSKIEIVGRSLPGGAVKVGRVGC